MKINNIATICIFLTTNVITFAHATPVSISTTSFLPYSIEAVYLDKYGFPQVNINTQDIPPGKYAIKFKNYRDQIVVSTKQFINIIQSNTEQQISLVLLPNQSVINI